jgi:hypothetical protein
MIKKMVLHNLIIRQDQDQAMTALLSGVVVLLIVCHLPKTIINMYESYQVSVLKRKKKDKPSYSGSFYSEWHETTWSNFVEVLLLSVKKKKKKKLYCEADF